MQKCEKCLTRFRWSQICKSQIGNRNFQSLICKECDTEHYIETSSKVLVYLMALAIITLTLFLIENFLYTSFVYYILAVLISVSIHTILFPFIVKFKSKYRTNYKSDY
ncbi:TIGR04104 family putative zinc finger protein [Aquibacillus rhizosphaerae]|uniref:TIGR04104 family putative zinc finger protein n=1 Tax=Aquibacillus rhizosphaerae TaxID=3051431 RepID=UPI0038B3DA4E